MTASNSAVSEMMADFGRRNKGRPLSPAKRKAILRNATHAWLTRTLKAFARANMAADAALAEALKRPKLKKHFTADQISAAYANILIENPNGK